MATEAIRVLLVEDQAVVRAGLRMVIESQEHMRVVGEAGDGQTALALAAQHAPDIVVLDIDLNGESGLDILPSLRAVSAARVLLLTGLRNPDDRRRGIVLGAVGLVLKDQAPEVLLKAIEKVHAGEVWLERTLMADVLNTLVQGGDATLANPETLKIDSLSEREREVIALICQGLPNKQIAARMGLSETTVRHHLTTIFDKLDLSSRLELVIYAYQHKLADIPPRQGDAPW